MKLHTDSVTSADIVRAADKAGTDFEVLESAGTRTRKSAFSVKLLGSSPHRPNSGYRGGDSDAHAASWDEWGIFLGALYALDADMVVAGGNGYQSAAHFHWMTGYRFLGLSHADQHRRHKWEADGDQGGYYQQSCACGAILRRLAGTTKWADVADDFAGVR